MRSNYFNNLYSMAKINLKNLLDQCTEEQKNIFNLMYPKGIDSISFDKLDWAFYQTENAIKDKKKQGTSLIYGVELEYVNDIDEILLGCEKPCLYFNTIGRTNNIPKDSSIDPSITEIKFNHSNSAYKQLLSIIKHCEDDNGENFKTLIIDQIDDLTSIHLNYINNPPDAFAASADELMKYYDEESCDIVNLFGKFKTLNLDIILIYDYKTKKEFEWSSEKTYRDFIKFISYEPDFLFGLKHDLSSKDNNLLIRIMKSRYNLKNVFDLKGTKISETFKYIVDKKYNKKGKL